MTLDRPWILVFAVLLLTLVMLVPAPDSAGATDREGAEALERVLRAYAEAGPFHETLEITLTMPDGSTGTRRQDYGVGGDDGAFFRLMADGRHGLRIVASRGRAVAVWSHVEGRYAETTYEGDFSAALEALEAPQVQLWAPPAVVAAQGGDRQAFLDALRFGILEAVEPVVVREALDDAGRALVEVELAAANGSARVGIDAVAGRLATVAVTLGEGESRVQAVGTFTYEAGEPAGELDWPETDGLASVATLTALEASEYPIGEPAPTPVVPALRGAPVDLGAFAGKVVVLDFWATWCVPCWSALEHTEALTAWAQESGLPVEVFAVDSLERVDSLDMQRQRAERFLASRDLEVEALIDHGDAAFAAFHNPGLPSLVIVGPDGRLAEYHSGVLEDMTDRVRARVLELLREPD